MHRGGHWFDDIHGGKRCRLCGLQVPLSATLSRQDQEDLIRHCLATVPECPYKDMAKSLIEAESFPTFPEAVLRFYRKAVEEIVAVDGHAGRCGGVFICIACKMRWWAAKARIFDRENS